MKVEPWADGLEGSARSRLPVGGIAMWFSGLQEPARFGFL